jgi:uncharacterized heparinase superfamily protein
MAEPKPLLGRRLIRLPPMPWLSAAKRIVVRQAAIESFGAPGYSLTLSRPKTEGFGAAPRDFRPVDRMAGRITASGRFQFGGGMLDAPAPGDPWSRPSPSRGFAMALHRFAWAPDLVALGEQGAYEALRLVLGWDAVFGRWSPFAWGRDVLSRRVFNLACCARRMAMTSHAETATVLADILARQARHLLRLPDGRAWAAEQTIAAAVAGTALAGDAGDRLIRRALPRLRTALNRTVMADGSHASRAPEAGLELLFDLLTLDDALLQRGVEAPAEIGRSIDRLTLATRALTLPDGRLACFQGGEASSVARVAAALAHDESEGEPPQGLPDGGYQRLRGQMLQVMVDSDTPARGAYAYSACAQPLAIEVVCGRDRLITNCAWSPREPERQGFRLTAAGSTLTLGEASVLSPLDGQLAEILGPRLEGPDLRVLARREEGEGAIRMELAHDGWVPRWGLTHERVLYVDVRADELRGEDRLVPVEGARPHALAVPYSLRFHLHPDVKVAMAADHKSVLLRGPSGRGWWFRNDAAEVSVEAGAWFEDGAARRATQIVLRGVARTDNVTRVRWKIMPAGAASEFDRM